MSSNRVIFVINEDVHVLDLAGPLQVFYEAETYGIPYDIIYVSEKPEQRLSSKLHLHQLRPLNNVDITAEDIVIIPGFEVKTFTKGNHDAFFRWLTHAHQQGAILCSVCTGSFALAAAGLLDGGKCTTHWKYLDEFQSRYPKLLVEKDKVFVQHNNIFTSAGVTTGIDVALYIIEQRHGAEFAFKLAREMVVYMRRNGDEVQQSIYLQHRQHMSTSVHVLQDWLSQNLHTKCNLDELAAIIHSSPRNLTRLFKATTGITIGQYIEKLRVEKAMQLLQQNNKVATVATACGFTTAAQLRNIIQKHAGALPSVFNKLS